MDVRINRGAGLATLWVWVGIGTGIALGACGDDYSNNGGADAATNCMDSTDCNDSDLCTSDTCNLETGRCEYIPLDEDGDGMSSVECGGFDCDDTDPEIHTGAPERCNGIDDDCDGELPPGELDGDGDGFAACGLDGPASGDCDDDADIVHPGGREICGNGIDDNCNGLVDGLDLACATEPDNDTCIAPEALTLPATIQASTLTAANDSEGSCGGEAPDLVYAIQLDGLWHLTARADTLDAQYDPLLYLRRECENPAAEVACEDDSDGLVPIVSVRAPPAGLYHLFVDGAAPNDIGDFELSVSATPVVNDLCADAVDVSTGGVWTGSTLDLHNHYQASCGANAPGNDAVFFFTLTQPRHVYLDLAGTTYSYTLLHLQETCGDWTSELACEYDPSASNPRSIDIDLGAGTYYVLVDSGYANYNGDYMLTVSFSMQ